MALLDLLLAGVTPRPDAWPDAIGTPVVVAVGAHDGRHRTALAVLQRLAADRPSLTVVAAPPAAHWPFLDAPADVAAWPSGPVAVLAADVTAAFENAQGNSTRLVTTQPAYLLEHWLAALARHGDATLVATADPAALERLAPDASGGRGPWARVTVLAGPATAPGAAAPPAGDATPTSAAARLAAAFRGASPAARLEAAVRAVDEAGTPAHLLALASVCMEVNDLENARTRLDEAVAAAPDRGAAWFEHGKLWLRLDEMERAAASFGRAADLLPGFAAAAANWGATLGELDRPAEALAAFQRALAVDPDDAQALNNVGVVWRELGRLDESEAAFRRVIALTPELAFGHYNLGHTLFLQGRYQASLNAYRSGQQLDPSRNAVQASRLALARLATGDAPGALRDLQSCTAMLPAALRRQILGDAHAVAWALLSTSPDLPGWRLVGDWLAAELGR